VIRITIPQTKWLNFIRKCQSTSVPEKVLQKLGSNRDEKKLANEAIADLTG
jgi:hypothetical protein